MKKIPSLILIFLGVIFLDQSSKFIADYFDTISLNRGLALGIFSNFYLILLFNILALFIFLFLAFQLKVSKKFLTIILASGSSNLIDRILFGGVRDWIFLPILGIKNNLSDWLIFLTVIFIFIKFYKEEKNNED